MNVYFVSLQALHTSICRAAGDGMSEILERRTADRLIFEIRASIVGWSASTLTLLQILMHLSDGGRQPFQSYLSPQSIRPQRAEFHTLSPNLFTPFGIPARGLSVEKQRKKTD